MYNSLIPEMHRINRCNRAKVRGLNVDNKIQQVYQHDNRVMCNARLIDKCLSCYSMCYLFFHVLSCGQPCTFDI